VNDDGEVYIIISSHPPKFLNNLILEVESILYINILLLVSLLLITQHELEVVQAHVGDLVHVDGVLYGIDH
jgi:hypothetical protein